MAGVTMPQHLITEFSVSCCCHCFCHCRCHCQFQDVVYAHTHTRVIQLVMLTGRQPLGNRLHCAELHNSLRVCVAAAAAVEAAAAASSSSSAWRLKTRVSRVQATRDASSCWSMHALEQQFGDTIKTERAEVYRDPWEGERVWEG